MANNTQWKEWRPKGNAAIALLAKRSTTSSTHQAATPEENEPLVAYVSEQGDDDTGTGSRSRPFRTFRAAVESLGVPSSADDFEHPRVVRTRGPVRDGADQPDVVVPTGRWLVELDAGSVFPRAAWHPRLSEQHGSTEAPSLALVGRALWEGARASVAGLTVSSIDVVPLAGDIPVVVCQLALVNVDTMGTINEGAGLAHAPLQLSVDGAAIGDNVVATRARLAGRDSLFLGTVSVGTLLDVHHCTFADAITIRTGQTSRVASQSNGFRDCTFDAGLLGTGFTLTVTDAAGVTMDEPSVDSFINGFWNVATGWTAIRGPLPDGESHFDIVGAGTQTDMVCHVRLNSADNPVNSADWGSSRFPFATVQAALDFAHASNAVPPANKDEFRSRLTLILHPGEHHGAVAGAGFADVDLGTRDHVRIVLIDSSLASAISWNVKASLKFGETQTPNLDIVSWGRDLSPRIVGDGVDAIKLVDNSGPPADSASCRLKSWGVRFSGAITSPYIGASPSMNLDLRNTQISGAVSVANGLPDCVDCTFSSTVQLYSILSGFMRCNFADDITFAASAGAAAPSSGRSLFADCTFVAAAKSITVAAGQPVCLDESTNGALKKGGWAIHPATAVVELRDDAVAIIPT